MKKAMSKTKKMGTGGMHMMPDGSQMMNSEMKKGGAKPKAMYGTSMKPDMMKKGGSTASKTSKMAMGGSLKSVPSDKVGLSKLPTAVRNKMGYKKSGGATPKKK